ncbi:MAG: protoheme IX farnesyltransferase [Sphingobacteriales bacterium UTBCD1]|jgi:protoheme IX farnesyltransferase|nr:MAG: protoheme IX farnesyltransferase [Sphingobacteriales bacterium UTBCD1]
MKKIKDYLLLIKPSLSILVVFSSVVSYLLAPKVVEFDWKMIGLLFAGGMLVTGSANAINQTKEKDTDAVMKRTRNRPVAAGRMNQEEGWGFAIVTGALGLFLLGYFFNLLSAGLAAFSLFLYGFIYTPLKKVNSMAVIAGAFPGALPCLIGWAAGNDQLTVGGWLLFAMQFLWQFPHFWAIAWIAHKDYTTAGFKLLPSQEGPTKFTAIQTVIYSLLLFPVSLLPYYTGMCRYVGVSGVICLLLVILANVFMIMRSFTLYRKMDVSSARKVMFGSYIYLAVVLLAFLLSKA